MMGFQIPVGEPVNNVQAASIPMAINLSGFGPEHRLQHVGDIKKWSVERKASKTTIRRPALKECRGYYQNP